MSNRQDYMIPSKYIEKTDTYEYKINKRYGTDVFWIDDISILYDRKYLTSFFPVYHKSLKKHLASNLNSIVRLCFYLSLFLMLYTKNTNYLLLFIMSFPITYIIYNIYFTHIEKSNKMNVKNVDELTDKLKINKTSITELKNNYSMYDNSISNDLPTINNPFMNFNYLTDNYQKEYKEKVFLDAFDKQTEQKNNEIKELVNASFDHNLYRDVSDIYGKNNSQREFYTMPVTSAVNNQSTFAKWLYRNGPTCKESRYECVSY
jgi:hypothetical protein